MVLGPTDWLYQQTLEPGKGPGQRTCKHKDRDDPSMPCSYTRLVSGSNQMNSCFSRHLEKVHGLTYGSYKQDEENVLPGTLANCKGFIDWKVANGIPDSAFTGWRWENIRKGAPGFKLCGGVDSLKSLTHLRSDDLRGRITKEFSGRQTSIAIAGGTTWGSTVYAFMLIRRSATSTLAWPLAMVAKPEDGGTEENLTKLIRDVTATAGDISVVSICTDNARALRNAANTVARERSAVFTPCFVHCIQLEVSRHVLRGKEFESVCELAAKSSTWRAPCIARWWSTSISVEKVIKNGDKDGITFADLDRLSKAIAPMKRLRTFGRILESDDTTQKHALRLFIASANVEGLPPDFKRGMKNRFCKIITTSMVLQAILSPNCVLETSEFHALRREVGELICTLLRITAEVEKGKVLRELQQWCLTRDEQTRYFSRSPESHIAKDFWMTDAREVLRYLAQAHDKLQHVLCSEASVERLFSLREYVHSASRNRILEDSIMDEAIIAAHARCETVVRAKTSGKGKRLRDDEGVVDVEAPDEFDVVDQQSWEEAPHCDEGHIELTKDECRFIVNAHWNNIRFNQVKVGDELAFTVVQSEGEVKRTIDKKHLEGFLGFTFLKQNSDLQPITWYLADMNPEDWRLL